MRKVKTLGCVMLAAVVLCSSPMVFAEAGQSTDDVPFQMLLKGYDVKSIHAAADHVMFGSLSLARGEAPKVTT